MRSEPIACRVSRPAHSHRPLTPPGALRGFQGIFFLSCSTLFKTRASLSHSLPLPLCEYVLGVSWYVGRPKRPGLSTHSPACTANKNKLFLHNCVSWNNLPPSPALVPRHFDSGTRQTNLGGVFANFCSQHEYFCSCQALQASSFGVSPIPLHRTANLIAITCLETLLLALIALTCLKYSSFVILEVICLYQS